MPDTVGQRISQLIASLGISKNAFALSLDKTATVIQHLVDERNKPGFDLLCKIFEVYPKVSKSWLMQGQGAMLNDDGMPPLATATNGAGWPVEEQKEAEEAEKTVVAPAAQAAPEPLAAPGAVPATPPAAPSVVPPAGPAIEPVAAPTATPASVPPAATPTPPGLTEANLQAALYAQQMGHQLALAELRNQHLLEQQRMMQQMMELMQRQLTH